jgi:hypothetical protein
MRRLVAGARVLLAWTLMASLLGAPGCSDRAADAPNAPQGAASSPDAAQGKTEPEARPAPAAEAEPAGEAAVVASDDLRAMVSPIALYPDPLLGLVLQGSTQPAQVVLAQRFLERYEQDTALTPDEDWDDSVIGLLNYPDIVGGMNDSLDWTQELGQAVAEDLDGVQLAVQELRWSAYQGGILRSNEYQEVVVARDIIAILPAQKESIAVPQYEGGDLLAASAPASDAFAQDGGGAASGTTVVVQQPAAVPIAYASPAPSFWSTAAVFAGGAMVGGLLGYALGDDDDDDWDDWDWDDDWDDRPWRGWGGGGYRGDIDVDIDNTNNFIRPARPGVDLRPNRPIVNRPGGGLGNRPGAGIGNRPSGIGDRPTTRPARPRPVVGKPGSGFHERPAASRPRPGRPAVGRPGATRPAGVAPARPSTRPAARPSKQVAMPRPHGPRPGGARPATRPASAQRPADRAAFAKRPQARPAARPGSTRDRPAALAHRGSPPQIQRERARGAASRNVAAKRKGGGAAARPQMKQQRHAAARPQKAAKQRPAMQRQGGGGGGGKAKAAGARGRASRGR